VRNFWLEIHKDFGKNEEKVSQKIKVKIPVTLSKYGVVYIKMHSLLTSTLDGDD
jgi:hypothetical protein